MTSARVAALCVAAAIELLAMVHTQIRLIWRIECPSSLWIGLGRRLAARECGF